MSEIVEVKLAVLVARRVPGLKSNLRRSNSATMARTICVLRLRRDTLLVDPQSAWSTSGNKLYPVLRYL